MASISFGNGVSNIKGSIAGNTYSGGANGAYIRNKAKPSKPNTQSQQAVRAIFNAIVTLWRALTDTQQSSWIAQAPNYTYIDNVGQTKQYTGFQLFVKLNTVLLGNGFTTLTTAQPPAGVASLQELELAVSQGGGTLSVDSQALVAQGDGTFDSVVPDGVAIIVSATAPYNSGKYRPKAGDFRKLGMLSPGDDPSEIDVGSAYHNLFGTPHIGTTVWVNWTVINTLTGEQQNQLFTASAVTTT